METRNILGVAALVGSILVACDGSSSAADETVAVGCSGKCDGLADVKNLLRDPSELDLSDLLGADAPLVTDQVNQFLAEVPFVDIALAQPVFHHAADLDELATGLATRFGETELATQVNRVRAEHLATTDDTTYAEMAVNIAPEVAQKWSFETGGLESLTGVNARVGFEADAAIEGRVIAAYDSEPDDLLVELAVRRGFIVPRTLEELRAMKPGELLALRGEGRLGANVGISVPLLIANPLSSLTFDAVVSAGLRSLLAGTLNVQMVRLDGSEIVVDVGVERARVLSTRVALEDEWGALGIIAAGVNIAGRDVNLEGLVGEALSKELEDKLHRISLHAERSTTKTRASVARFRIDLDRVDPNVLGPLLTQTILGDIRLAQALANRNEPGIRSEFDIMRSGLSTTLEAGVDVFGVEAYKQKIESEGSVVVQTPGGARAVLFDSLHKESGVFLKRHGYTRVALAGMTWDAEGNSLESEANLFVQVLESDRRMQRDKYVDHLDSLIIAIAGPDVYAALDASGNALQRQVQDLCSALTTAFSSCGHEAFHDEDLQRDLAAAKAEYQGAIAGFDDQTRELLTMAGNHKLLAQATYEVEFDPLIGPGTDVFLDFRLDNASLSDLAFNRTGADLMVALEVLLAATEVDRGDTPQEIDDDRREMFVDSQPDLQKLANTYDAFAVAYRQLVEAETANLDGIGELGPDTMQIKFEVDADNRPILESAAVESLAHARAELAAKLFDDLEAGANEWDAHEEQVVAYGLLALSMPDHLDLALTIHHDLSDSSTARRKAYREANYPEHLRAYARGPNTQPIDGGLFDVDAEMLVSE